jgi:hypothetical protein
MAETSWRRVLPGWERMLSRERAAAYCGVSVNHFDRECPVAPVRLGARVLYDRHRIDAWLDGLAGGADAAPDPGRGPDDALVEEWDRA